MQAPDFVQANLRGFVGTTSTSMPASSTCGEESCTPSSARSRPMHPEVSCHSHLLCSKHCSPGVGKLPTPARMIGSSPVRECAERNRSARTPSFVGMCGLRSQRRESRGQWVAYLSPLHFDLVDRERGERQGDTGTSTSR